MKPDHQDKVESWQVHAKVDGKAEVPPYWDEYGMPFKGTREKLTVMWLEGQAKIIFCQACWQTFVVVSEFGGDPPYHNRSDGKLCVGNTMLHLDPLNDVGDLEFIQADYVYRYALKAHNSFWCSETAGRWRADYRKNRR